MRTLKSQPQHAAWLTYAILTISLISLFLIGLRLGNQLLAPQSQSGPAAVDDKPSGGAVVNPPFQVHDFALTNQAGAPMSLKDLRERAVALFFGYTHCPDVCPLTLADFTRVKKLLGAQANRVEFVFVTVDSKRDTPEVINSFLNQFDPGIIGLTGDETTLRSMAAQYGAYFSLSAAQTQGDGATDHHEGDIGSDNYFVEHTSPAYLIDPKGFLRMVFFNGTSPEVIASGIQRILQDASN